MLTMSKALFLLISFMLQSCVSYNWIRNKQSTRSCYSYKNNCDIKFYLDFHFIKGNENTYNKKTTEQDYINDTKEVFAGKQCDAIYAYFEPDANFKISVNINDPEWDEWGCKSAAGFSGITFMYLPTWCTEKGKDKFTFENITSAKSYTYYIDERTFFHASLIPFAWVNFLTYDNDIYKKALINFIDFTEKDSSSIQQCE